MGIYEGLLEFRRNKTKLWVCPLYEEGITLRSMDPEFVYEIRINDKLSIDEQVKTLIHEAWHFVPKFRPYHGMILGIKHTVELEIESLTETVFHCQPILVEFLRQRLQKNVSLEDYLYNKKMRR